MPDEEDGQEESYFKRLSREFDELALRFAQICLQQPESSLAEDRRRIFVRPDGYNFGPESFADLSYIDYDDIAWMLPVVTYWCRLNFVELTIVFSEESYVCRVIEGSPPNIIESQGSGNLCFELLVVCTTLAEKMKRINPPYPTVRTNNLSETQP